MIKKETYNKWLEAAYQEFSCCGPDFSLKALARKANLPRATLYYHFDDKEHLLSELLSYHQSQINLYFCDLRNEVKMLIPDLYKVMYKYKEGILFHRQLLKNCHEDIFCELYKSTNEESIKILLPLIKVHFVTIKSDQELIQFYHTLTDAWYIRLNPKKLSVQYMIDLAVEIMESTLI
jgi:AcrR family transcriptional regulator